jgi:hypothetical protein
VKERVKERVRGRKGESEVERKDGWVKEKPRREQRKEEGRERERRED